MGLRYNNFLNLEDRLKDDVVSFAFELFDLILWCIC